MQRTISIARASRHWLATRQVSTISVCNQKPVLPLSRLQAFVGQQMEADSFQFYDLESQPSVSFTQLDKMGLNLQWMVDPSAILSEAQVRAVPSSGPLAPLLSMETSNAANSLLVSTSGTSEASSFATSMIAPSADRADAFQLSSVLKKRHRKMKRHKYKKWRKKMRSVLKKK
eukprot:TRINITY_DN11972_c0_g2_i1.p1 TRINITY_DN11972_c0_g2~~TRINITY_DN11972_c0_g2_i1.p1  ORF type:complete len:173 (+),score=21.99 TRINITY_DN11972_c0_g2_i1:82-600(+)